MSRWFAPFTVAILVLGPVSAFALDYDDSVHFLARTGFGAPPRVVAALATLSRPQAVELVISGLRTDPPNPPPLWCAPPFPRPPGDKAHPPDAEEKKAFDQVVEEHKQELRSWFITSLVTTPSPLTEKMVLFWHNHRTVAEGFWGIKDPGLLSSVFPSVTETLPLFKP